MSRTKRKVYIEKVYNLLIPKKGEKKNFLRVHLNWLVENLFRPIY